MLSSGALIDGFGVGTALVNSIDSPALGVIYKLVETESDHEERPVAKFSPEKATYPGKKQVYRAHDSLGRYCGDTIGLAGENLPSTEALLVPVMKDGKRTVPRTDLSEGRKRCLDQAERLPRELLSLGPAATAYPVHYSQPLEDSLAEVRRRLEGAARVGRP